MPDHIDATACSIDVRGDARAVTLRVQGALDRRGGLQLEAALRGQLATGRRDLAVDLAGCTALDAQGIAAIERAGDLIRRAGGLLRLNDASAAVRDALSSGQGSPGRAVLRLAPGSSAQQAPGSRSSTSEDSTQLLRHLFAGIPEAEQPRLVELLSRDGGENGARLDPAAFTRRRRRATATAPRDAEDA